MTQESDINLENNSEEELDLVGDAKVKLADLLAGFSRWAQELPLRLGFTPQEVEIFSLGLLYQQIRRKFYADSGGKGYPVWGPIHTRKDPRKSKNWIHFSKTLELIRDYGFDPAQHLTAQIEILKNLGNPLRFFPWPAMMHSATASERTYAWLANEEALGYLEPRPIHQLLDLDFNANQKEIRYSILKVGELIHRFPFLETEEDIYLKYPFFRRELSDAYLSQSPVYAKIEELGFFETNFNFPEWQAYVRMLRGREGDKRGEGKTSAIFQLRRPQVWSIDLGRNKKRGSRN